MTQILYANGCLYTNGSELFTEGFNNFEAYKHIANMDAQALRDRGYVEFADFNLTQGYPGVLAKKLNYELLNCSVGGSSNERIFYTTISDINKLLETKKPEEILAVIGWSSLDRTIMFLQGQYSTVIPFSTMGLPFATKGYRAFLEENSENQYYLGLFRYIRQLHQISNFFKRKGVRFIMFDALPSSYEAMNLVHLTQQVHNNRVLNDAFETLHKNPVFYYKNRQPETLGDLMYLKIFSSMNYYMSENKLPGCGFGHPGVEAHRRWAEVLYAQLTKDGMV